MAKKKVVYDFKEEFIKADNAATENNQIEVMLEELLEKNRDNEVLQEYLALQKKLEDNNIIYNDAKKNMYEGMEASDIDYLEGMSIIANLTHAYTKKELDQDKLKEDLGEEKFNSYLMEKSVKGNVKFKPKPEV
jgi:hypothetical protein